MVRPKIPRYGNCEVNLHSGGFDAKLVLGRVVT
jgi:hypothetical protein